MSSPRDDVLAHRYNEARAAVLAAAREGRAVYIPAGARHNATAEIYVDGELVGQASVCGHYVNPAPDSPRFGECILVPAPDWQIPEALR